MRRAARNRPGFTLIETIAAIVVLTALASIASFITVETVDNYIDATTGGQLHGEAALGLDRMVREIRKIGLDTGAAGTAPDIDTVTPESIVWHGGDYSLSLSGDQVLYAASGVTRLGAWTTGLTHGATSGPNRLLLFAVAYENSGSDPGVSSVSYGGQSMTQVVAEVAGTSTYDRVELWRLNDAGIAAATDSDFSVVWGGASPSDPMYAAATFANVDQGSAVLDSSSSFTNGSSPNPITTAVSLTTGARVVASAVSGNSGSYSWANPWDETTEQSSGGTTTMGTADAAAAAPGSDTASATHAGPNRQAIVAAVLNPVSATTGVLVDDVTAFAVRSFDESNAPLGANLSGAACDPIRRVELELTLQRHAVSQTTRTRTFIRSTMSGGGS